MANNLTKIIAGLLIFVAVLLGIYAWLLGRKPAPVLPVNQPVASRTFPVVVATHALPAGQPITVDELKVQQVSVVPAGAFTDPSALVGRVPANGIAAQSPVFESALTSGLADQVEPGERAVAIKVDETNAVGNRLRPGNFVDVFMNLKREGGIGATGSEIAKSQARLLLSRVRVLSFGDATPGRDITNGASGMGVRTAVLAVPTAEVDALTLAEASGRLVLALRSPQDDDVAAQTVAMRTGGPQDPSAQAAAGIVLSDLSRSESTQHPHAAVATRRMGNSIEVIRGGRAETVAY